MSAVLSLGSNLGDRMAHLRGGLAVIAEQVPVAAVSPVYETEPVGGPEQGPFLNAVVVVELDDAQGALELAQRAERSRGRERDVRWGPRTLDVDVIDVDGQVRSDPELTLPHPRAHLRAFVLVPWHDVAPEAVLPGWGPVAERLAGLDRRGVCRRDDLDLAEAT